MPVGEQPRHHGVVAQVLGLQELLELVEQQPEDTGLGGVHPGDDLPAARTKRLHESF